MKVHKIGYSKKNKQEDLIASKLSLLEINNKSKNCLIFFKKESY
jgi:hypothetical protein